MNGNPPFSRSGVDFFGSIYLKQKRSKLKRLGCNFVCKSIRVIHIELVESLDTDCFIGVMQRFINQRRRPFLIVPDRGTHFRGAVNELQIEVSKFDHIKIGSKFSVQQIQWMFSLPSSVNIGGTWASVIRTVQEAVFAIIKNKTLTGLQMLTLFIEFEILVSNCSLSNVSKDYEDLESLIQNYFLIKRNF